MCFANPYQTECFMYNQMIDGSAPRGANRHVVRGQPCRVHVFLYRGLQKGEGGFQPQQTCDLNLLDRRSVLACPARRSVYKGINVLPAIPLTTQRRRDAVECKKENHWERNSEGGAQVHMYTINCACSCRWPGVLHYLCHLSPTWGDTSVARAPNQPLTYIHTVHMHLHVRTPGLASGRSASFYSPCGAVFEWWLFASCSEECQRLRGSNDEEQYSPRGNCEDFISALKLTVKEMLTMRVCVDHSVGKRG